MKCITAISRLLVVGVVLAALVCLGAGTSRAQEAGATPVASPAVYYVTAACNVHPELNQSTCSFSAQAKDGPVADGLTVPAAVVCATVAAAGGAQLVGGGYQSGASDGASVTLTLAGQVAVAGSASYSVAAGGATLDAAGDGLACTAAPAVAAVPVTTQDPPPAPGSPAAVDIAAVPASPAAEVPAVVSASPVAETTAPKTGLGAADSTPVGLVVNVTVGVSAFNCETDPGTADPATVANCAAANAVEVAVSQNGGAATTHTTDATGRFTVVAPQGANLAFQENLGTINSGYFPIGDGSASIAQAANGKSVVFVHLKKALIGRLQVVNGSCPTSGAARTEFTVIKPHSFQAAAQPACAPTVGAAFTITGGDLGAGAIPIVTDSRGTWRGYLPASATAYTVTDAGAHSRSFPIVADEITIVVAVDYIAVPKGTLTVKKVLCTKGATEGTDINVVSGTGGSPAGASCVPTNGDFTLGPGGADTTGRSVVSFSLGAGGQVSLPLTVGPYILTDLDSGKTVKVDLQGSVTTVATVRKTVLRGTLVVGHFLCADPTSAAENAAAPGYWTSTCAQPNGGVALTLLNGDGNVVNQQTGSDGGVITWQSLGPGTYSVKSDGGLCAVFVDGTDARSGFAVQAGATTQVSVYTCAAAKSGDGTGSAGGSAAVTNSASVPVTTLPNTGTGRGLPLPLGDALVVVLAALILASGGIASVRSRRT